MSAQSNPENNIAFIVPSGEHKDKIYLFTESNRRWAGLRNYVKKRPEQFLRARYFLATKIRDNKWKYAQYGLTPYNDNLPLPEVIYDIERDKVYEYKGQLWQLK